jgi:hypothetical protein
VTNSQESEVRKLPFLVDQPEIDGNIDEWKSIAFTDGVWDLQRIQKSSWYHPKRNRLTVEPSEDTTLLDLNAAYYMAWDDKYLYFAAEVRDNVHDVEEKMHESKRWYYKDAIAWFIESPIDDEPEKFALGDHAFAFVIDTLKPDYGAWWRHGSNTETFIEEPIPAESVDYAIVMDPWGRSPADYIIEARVARSLLSIGGYDMNQSEAFDSIGMMIVHCDPDGGEYGGHLLIYGKGDDDSTWSEFKLDKSPIPIIKRSDEN